MKKVVTAQQVARTAGVSPTTVSFVMNDVKNANISEATRQRVLQVAEELGYVPHALAKSLAKGRSDNIGLFLIQPHSQIFADPYIPNIIGGLRQAIQNDGFRILVEQINSAADADKVLKMLKSGEIAGAVVNHSAWSEAQLQQLLPYPIVSLSAYGERPEIPTVAINHNQGVRELATHLAALHRHPIGVISYAPLDISYVRRRFDMFRETLSEHGHTLHDEYVREGSYQPQTGYDAMQSLYEDHPEIEAVYCMNDMMAVGALSYLNQHGVRVPGDVAIVGYDDIRVSAYLNPPLTTVRAPEVDLGKAAGRLLLQLINNESPDERRQLLPTQLVIRQSCGYQP